MVICLWFHIKNIQGSGSSSVFKNKFGGLSLTGPNLEVANFLAAAGQDMTC